LHTLVRLNTCYWNNWYWSPSKAQGLWRNDTAGAQEAVLQWFILYTETLSAV